MNLTREQIFDKIFKSINKRKNIRLHLAPRFGKTKLIIEVIKRDDPKTILWVTPSRRSVNLSEYVHQWF